MKEQRVDISRVDILVKEQPFDIGYDINILGNVGTGKTSLMRTFDDPSHSPYNHKFTSTERFLKIEDKVIKLTVEDILATSIVIQEKVQRSLTLTEACAKFTGSIVCYDITRPETFEDAKGVIDEIREIKQAGDLAGNPYTIMLVGMKSDLENSRRVTTDELSAFEKQQPDIKCMEASAVDSKSVEEVFDAMRIQIQTTHDLHAKKASLFNAIIEAIDIMKSVILPGLKTSISKSPFAYTAGDYDKCLASWNMISDVCEPIIKRFDNAQDVQNAFDMIDAHTQTFGHDKVTYKLFKYSTPKDIEYVSQLKILAEAIKKYQVDKYPSRLSDFDSDESDWVRVI